MIKEIKGFDGYYISDTGIRNIILGFRNINEGYLLENVVYLELLRRGYKVNIGKSNEYEVDFVAENPNDIKYSPMVLLTNHTPPTCLPLFCSINIFFMTFLPFKNYFNTIYK